MLDITSQFFEHARMSVDERERNSSSVMWLEVRSCGGALYFCVVCLLPEMVWQDTVSVQGAALLQKHI